MTTISATSILSSVAKQTGDRVDTLLLRYPRWIHAEGRTHRLMSLGEDFEISVPTPSLMEDPNLSRNASSSRAIPVSRLIQDVLDHPAVPLFWGKNQKGMQADEECNELVQLPDPEQINWLEKLTREQAWLRARDQAVETARAFSEAGYHKQVVNRLLEPFSHITVVVTSTNWSNFLHLRDHADAEPHIAMLAREIRKALEGATPQVLYPGDWHLPFVKPGEPRELRLQIADMGHMHSDLEQILHKWLLKLSVSRCASTSYDTVDGFEMTIDRAVTLHDKLVAQDPLHASPCEHQCTPDGFDFVAGRYHAPEKHGNLKGFVQYRKTLSGECR
jgi:hypothetical protein